MSIILCGRYGSRLASVVSQDLVKVVLCVFAWLSAVGCMPGHVARTGVRNIRQKVRATCSHSDANAAKSEHMTHLCPCCYYFQLCFCPPARLQLANSHNMLTGIGFMVDSSKVPPLFACNCSIMNAPVFTFGRYPRNFRQKVSIPGCSIRSLLNGWITSMEWPRFRETRRHG